MNESPADRIGYLRDARVAGVEVLRASVAEHRYPPHAHDTWTIALLSRGSATFMLDDRSLTATPGRPVVIPPGGVHTGEPGPDGYSYISIYLTPGLLDDVQSTTHGPTVADAARGVCAALASPATALRRSEAVEALCSALRRDADRSPPRRGGHRAVRRAEAMLRERWSEAVTIAELAAHAGVSRGRLIRLFREEHGLPPHAYQVNLRLHRARAMLLAGHPPAHVAAQTGFADQAHFTRHFRRTFALPPGRYASRIR